MENLQTLIDNRHNAYELFKANEKETIEKVSNFLKMHCTPEGVEPIFRLSVDTPWSREHSRYIITGKIAFKTDDPARLAKGWDDDFGSDFDIRIYEKSGIRINKGTIGEYGLEDKFQIARDKMLAMIWENHDTIIAIANETFNYDLYKDFMDKNELVARAERDLKEAEKARQKQETLRTLRTSSYLAKHRTRDKYESDIWSKVIGTIHFYIDVFKIEKITDKCVIGYYENRRWEKKRLNIDSVIFDLQNNHLMAFTSEPKEWEEAKEETSTN